MQVRNQFADIAFERTAADQIDVRFGIFFFHFGKGPDDDIHAVVSREAASANQVRAQRNALAIAELREVDDVRHGRSWQSEFAEDIDQIAGWNDNLIDARERELGRAEAWEVIAGLAAVIVDQSLAAACLHLREYRRGYGSEQEGPVSRG